MDTGTTARTVASGQTVPLLCIRLKNAFNGKPNRFYVRPGNLSVLATDAAVKYKLVLIESQANITGGTWFSADDDSAVDYNITATSVAGNLSAVTGGYVAVASRSQSSSFITAPTNARRQVIAQNFDSTDSQAFAVIVQSLGGTASCYAGMQWLEVT
jgi:hypothetical protein